MANPSYTYTLTNGTTADASQVMQNFTDILNGVTDGTKDLSISALTVAGSATFNGNMTIGNASGDDLTVTASLASSIPIKTDATYDIGSSTIGLRSIYMGRNSQRVRLIPSASTSASYTLTLPTDAGTSGYGLATDGSGVLSWSRFNPMTTAGDLIVGGTIGAAARLDTTKIGDLLSRYRAETFTITIASPGVGNSSSHGFVTGEKVYLTTTGALPTGLAVDTTYYVIRTGSNSFNLATSLINALAGTAINTSGSQSGTHTIVSGGFQVNTIPHVALGSTTVTTGLAGFLRSGTFTPTLTATANLDGIVGGSASMLWCQVGNVVYCTGEYTVDATAASTNTTFTISLPIVPTSNFAATSEASGTSSSNISGTVGYDGGIVFATTGAKTVTVQYVANSTASGRAGRYTFQYLVN